MKATIITATAFALALLLYGAQARADDDCGKHMRSYYKHMNEAYEKAREGDWEDYYEELGKAQKEYYKAQRERSPYYYDGPRYGAWGGYRDYDYRPRYDRRPSFGFWGSFGYGRGHGYRR